MSKIKEAAMAVEVLAKARDYLSNRGNWIKGSLADEGALPNDAPGYDAKNYRVCSIGAIMRAANVGRARYNNQPEESLAALKALVKVVTKRDTPNLYLSLNTIAEWNDNKATHADVLAAFDEAKEEACAIVREHGEKDRS